MPTYQHSQETDLVLFVLWIIVYTRNTTPHLTFFKLKSQKKEQQFGFIVTMQNIFSAQCS